MKALAAALLCALAGAPAFAGGPPLTAHEILMKVRADIGTVLGKRATDVAPERRLGDQGADELDIVEIIMSLEETFDIEIPDDEVERECGGDHREYTAACFARIVTRRVRRPENETD